MLLLLAGIKFYLVLLLLRMVLDCPKGIIGDMMERIKTNLIGFVLHEGGKLGIICMILVILGRQSLGLFGL